MDVYWSVLLAGLGDVAREDAHLREELHAAQYCRRS